MTAARRTERGGRGRVEEPSAGVREGPAPRMKKPSAGVRERPAPRTDERALFTDRRHVVWLASYPKSGNTWMRTLLANFFRAPHRAVPLNALPFPNAIDNFHFGELAGVAVEDCAADEVDRLIPAFLRASLQPPAAEPAARARPLLRKVHSAYVVNHDGEPLFPAELTAGAVYIVRNPLDVAVSFAFHAEDGDCARSVARLNDPDNTIGGGGKHQYLQRLLDWSGNVESWRSAPFPVLLVRYEDMLADTVSELRRVTRFLRLQGVTEARLRQAVARSSFAKLRGSETREGFVEKSRTHSGLFFREGGAGGWRRALSAAEARQIARRHHSTMAMLGYNSGGLSGRDASGDAGREW